MPMFGYRVFLWRRVFPGGWMSRYTCRSGFERTEMVGEAMCVIEWGGAGTCISGRLGGMEMLEEVGVTVSNDPFSTKPFDIVSGLISTCANAIEPAMNGGRKGA